MANPDTLMEIQDSAEATSVTWTYYSTKLFLDLYKNYRNKLGSFKMKNFKKMWSIISSDLQHNYQMYVSPANCENRWRVLERNYKKYIDNQNKTGQGRKDFEFTDEMNDILGMKKNLFPELLLSTDTVIHLQEEQSANACEESTILKESNSEMTTNYTPPRARKIRRQPARKLKSDTLQEMKRDRQDYYENRLKLENDKLQMEKEKLLVKEAKIELIKERNELFSKFLHEWKASLNL